MVEADVRIPGRTASKEVYFDDPTQLLKNSKPSFSEVTLSPDLNELRSIESSLATVILIEVILNSVLRLA